MTVRELIEKLKEMPQDAIVIHSGYYDLMFPVKNATYDPDGEHWGDNGKKPTLCPTVTLR